MEENDDEEDMAVQKIKEVDADNNDKELKEKEIKSDYR